MPEGTSHPTLRTRVLVSLAGTLAIAAIGAVDFFSGVELRIFPLYYLPIALVAWHLGRTGAVIAAAVSAAAWLSSNLWAGLSFSQQHIWIANVLLQGTSFAVVGLLIAALRNALIRERELSRSDPLTTLLNGRAFHVEAARLLALCRRNERPVTVAYIDLDNFKSVNDRLGHQAGDALLRSVAEVLRATTRPSDVAARLGGDEFVVLLPEVGPREAAIVLERLRSRLAGACASQLGPVTGSIGGVTFLTAPTDLHDVVHRSDTRMYAAKTAGKNRVHLEVVGD